LEVKSLEEWDAEARTRKGERYFVGFERRGEKEKEGEGRKRWRGREEEEERMEGRVAMYVELRVNNHKTQHLSLSLLFSSSSSLLFRFHCLVVAATIIIVGVIIVN
jgi:hypothetical protein